VTGDFYRISRVKELRGSLRKLLKDRRRVMLLLFGSVALCYLLFDNKGILRRISLEVEKRDLENKIALARLETRDLQVHLKAVEGDKKTIEKLARERYGMARKGETVYRVKKD
jgi:cell division protein FtsB